MLCIEWRAGPGYIAGGVGIFIMRLAKTLEVENGEIKLKFHHISNKYKMRCSTCRNNYLLRQ